MVVFITLLSPQQWLCVPHCAPGSCPAGCRPTTGLSLTDTPARRRRSSSAAHKHRWPGEGGGAPPSTGLQNCSVMSVLLVRRGCHGSAPCQRCDCRTRLCPRTSFATHPAASIGNNIMISRYAANPVIIVSRKKWKTEETFQN